MNWRELKRLLNFSLFMLNLIEKSEIFLNGFRKNNK